MFINFDASIISQRPSTVLNELIVDCEKSKENVKIKLIFFYLNIIKFLYTQVEACIASIN